jgi:hypothetical protein
MNDKKKNEARFHYTLRIIVALYLYYLCYQLFTGAGTKAEERPPVWVIGLCITFFAIFATGLLVFAYREYRKSKDEMKQEEEAFEALSEKKDRASGQTEKLTETETDTETKTETDKETVTNTEKETDTEGVEKNDDL